MSQKAVFILVCQAVPDLFVHSHRVLKLGLIIAFGVIQQGIGYSQRKWENLVTGKPRLKMDADARTLILVSISVSQNNFESGRCKWYLPNN